MSSRKRMINGAKALCLSQGAAACANPAIASDQVNRTGMGPIGGPTGGSGRKLVPIRAWWAYMAQNSMAIFRCFG